MSKIRIDPPQQGVIAIDPVELLRLLPGDVLAIHVPAGTGMADVVRVRRVVEDVLAMAGHFTVPVIVLTNEVQVTVVRADGPS